MTLKTRFGRSDFTLVARDKLYQGFFALEAFRFKHQTFEGGWSEVVSREVFLRPDATCVLLYDPALQQVVLLEQFRAGAVFESDSPWLFELVGGLNDKDEKPEAIAHRETEEEAGLAIMRMEKICEYLVSPGATTEKVHLYCAQVDSSLAHGQHGLQEEAEDIWVHQVDVDEAFAMLSEGLINNAAAVIAFQWLALNRTRLDKEWLA